MAKTTRIGTPRRSAAPRSPTVSRRALQRAFSLGYAAAARATFLYSQAGAPAVNYEAHRIAVVNIQTWFRQNALTAQRAEAEMLKVAMADPWCPK